jgi:predicted ABC-type exoprotein transport system permease subunit
VKSYLLQARHILFIVWTNQSSNFQACFAARFSDWNDYTGIFSRICDLSLVAYVQVNCICKMLQKINSLYRSFKKLRFQSIEHPSSYQHLAPMYTTHVREALAALFRAVSLSVA